MDRPRRQPPTANRSSLTHAVCPHPSPCRAVPARASRRRSRRRRGVSPPRPVQSERHSHSSPISSGPIRANFRENINNDPHRINLRTLKGATIFEIPDLLEEILTSMRGTFWMMP
ncbi:hypothetical protein HMI54_010994 [Coelomomyces lativittatus]|nr:hypothetical protein HMI54_010994 [Coelomomyces lativittatus]